MSTASVVPETWELSGDDAWQTLSHTGRWRLVKDAVMRMRTADGFSHARSLGLMTSLVLVQSLIALVGLASALGESSLSSGIVTVIQGAVPGPAGQLLTAAVDQAHKSGAQGRYLALVIGLVGSIVTATTAMGQLERGLNRLYGIEQDRPFEQKYGRAFVLAVSAGTLATAAFVVLAFGKTIGDQIDNHVLDMVWNTLRWPLGLALVATAVTMLFRWCPRRHQPAPSWLAFGAIVSVGLWFLVTVGLGAVFGASSSFGDTYGALAGLVALLLWAMLSAMALLFGAAVAAQLEAVRAGRPGPQDIEKVVESEPDARPPVPVGR
jgi:YihY family inner membrane protein